MHGVACDWRRPRSITVNSACRNQFRSIDLSEITLWICRFLKFFQGTSPFRSSVHVSAFLFSFHSSHLYWRHSRFELGRIWFCHIDCCEHTCNTIPTISLTLQLRRDRSKKDDDGIKPIIKYLLMKETAFVKGFTGCQAIISNWKDSYICETLLSP